MRATPSTVISMRLPEESGKRLKRLANRHGWTASDDSARLVARYRSEHSLFL
jgi:predicted DNA-binding protein